MEPDFRTTNHDSLFRVTASEGLATVGLTVQDIMDAAGDEFKAGPAYLVGSLASGLGNGSSDVDIHVLQSGLQAAVGPYMFFPRDVIVDVERYPAEWVAEITNRASSIVVADTGVGRMSLDTRLTGRACWWVSRWIHAAPLDPSSPAIFDEGEVEGILPLLVRDAYDALLLRVAVARLSDAADVPAPAREFLWRQASRQLFDLCSRAAGDVTPSQKWVTSRATRLSLPDLVEAADAASFIRLAARYGLPTVDEWELVSVQQAEGSGTVRLAGQKMLKTRHNRLLGESSVADGNLREIVDSLGPATLFHSIRRAEVDISVDPAAVRKALSS